jgi:plasmid maintenance system killer protein
MQLIRGMLIAGAVLMAGQVGMAAEEAASAPATRAARRTMGTPAEMPAELSARIDKGIELIEAKKYKELIETLSSPRTMQRFKEKGDLEATAAGFEKKAGELLKILKEAKTQKVLLAPDGNRAGLMDANGKRTITFDKVDGVWYLGN